MDFTLKKYAGLLSALKDAGYQDVCRLGGSGRQVLLRHDVDLRPGYSLRVARLEAEMGVRAIYYFRAVPESWDDDVILQIQSLGHEIGYHYESLTTCNGDTDAAYKDFCNNLERLGSLIGHPVKTICMHGSPRSPHDSKDIWKKYDYHEQGIDYEPYLDTDFSQVFYLTDTGRRWDGYNVSVRDKIPVYQDRWNENGLMYHSTDDLICAIKAADSAFKECCPRVMITTHPQRWMPFGGRWVEEFVLQNVKNKIKSVAIRRTQQNGGV